MNRIKDFLEILKRSDKLVSEFDEGLWKMTVDRVVVYRDDRALFIFNDGMEIEWGI